MSVDVVKVAAWLPVSAEVPLDRGHPWQSVAVAFGRPDPNPMPRFVLFPSLKRRTS